MTLKEAAIISCEDRIRRLENAPKHHHGKRRRERAVELERVKIAALRPVSREQVVKVWRGEWQYHPEDYDELTWTCSRCGEVWTLIDGTPDDNNMDFCPACGAPMTDEAVEMVMKRLEALYEQTKAD